jgi:phosphohistidine swiveling domain-containing protein
MSSIIPSHTIQKNYAKFGGKATGLFLLKEVGFRVPEFFLIEHSTITELINQPEKLQTLVDEWKTANSIDNFSLWAIRSSADVEDGNTDSYAGLFRTEINVPVEKVAVAIAKLIEAYLSFSGKQYGSKSSLEFSIIIQEMIRSEVSGVVFSKNPLAQNDKKSVINLIPGLGENLVSGRYEGLKGSFYKRKFNWEELESVYHGQIMDSELREITLSGHQIVNSVQPFFSEILAGINKLEKIKKHPIDVEITISDSMLYWLQVRSITTLGNAPEVFIYDNSNIGENYPGMSLPLTISFVKQTYFEAYTRMSSFFGMRKNAARQNHFLFDNMVGGINGALYYNITAWQQLLYQLPFGRKTSKHLPKLLGMEPALFSNPKVRSGILNYLVLIKNIALSFIRLKKHNKNYERVCESVLFQFKSIDLNLKDHLELIGLYREVEKKLIENWLAPILNGFFAMLFFSLLRKTFSNSRLQKKHPNFINDILFSQGDIVSVQIVRSYQGLIGEIRETPALKSVFEEQLPEDVLIKLEKDFPAFYLKFCEYLENYGARCDDGELKMETVNYSEDPLKFTNLIKSNLEVYPLHDNNNEPSDYRDVIRKEYWLNLLKRLTLLSLIKYTLPLIRNRENYRFTRTRIFALIRTIFREIDKKLLNDKKIENKGDSLWLEFNEILNPMLSDTCKQTISERKKQYTDYQNLPRSNRYEKRGEKFVPVSPAKISETKNKLKGTGCCSGIVTNKVKIVTSENVNTGNFQGYILAAEYFEPGWINVFSQASGVISARGNLLGHTAILCREMGIPSIIGVKNILKNIQENDLVQMNGSTGEIFIEHDGS